MGGVPNISGAIGTVINAPLASGMIYATTLTDNIPGGGGWGAVKVFADASVRFVKFLALNCPIILGHQFRWP